VRSGSCNTMAWPSSVSKAIAETRQGWLSCKEIPYAALTIPDSCLKANLDAALRTVYQGREIINGFRQFQPGVTVYRGLWMDCAIYCVDLMSQLGDSASAREMLLGLLALEKEPGLLQVMEPDPLLRETPEALWALGRYASRSGDWAFIREHWPFVQRALQKAQELRNRTLAQPGAVNYGLMPASFADGGISGVAPEYSSVTWYLLALREVGNMARHLRQQADADAAGSLYAALHCAFQLAAQRDQRRDDKGNLYLPLIVGQSGEDAHKQAAQWLLLEAYPFGDVFPERDELILGTVNMHRNIELQGLPAGTGWLKGGIWAGYGGLYGHVLVQVGESAKAIDVLYAVVNHASPVGTWAEEQPPLGSNLKPAGDFPHTWHGVELWRFVLAMLAMDRGNQLKLLEALPPEWLKAGAEIHLHALQTLFGPLQMDVKVAENGQEAVCELELPQACLDSEAWLHPGAFLSAGFANRYALAANQRIPLSWGKRIILRFRK
jgi:hypothetical protein